MTLGELSDLIRSKNAGPFVLTIDIIFKDRAAYDIATVSKNIGVEKIADIYSICPNTIEYYLLPSINAIKISFPRPCTSGALGDDDVFGGQLHAPIVNLEI